MRLLTKIKKAVVPAAGLGTRMKFLTTQTPKEMLPIADKPMIEWAVDELLSSGVEQIYIIISPNKEIIKDYFLSKKYHSQLHFVYQHKPLGVSKAILEVENLIKDEPFILAFTDQLVLSDIPVTQQLINIYHQSIQPAIWTSLVQVPSTEISYFTGSGYDYEKKGETFSIKKRLTDQETNQRYNKLKFQIRGFGRTILQPVILDYFSQAPFNQKTEEYDFAQAFDKYAHNFPHKGVMLQGKAGDFGTLAGYKYYKKIWDKYV